MTPQELEIPILEPESVFGSPEEVLENLELSRDQKIEILLRWEYDAAEEAVALEEDMPVQESDLQRRTLVALGKLTDAIDFEHTGPSKQYGIARTPVRRPNAIAGRLGYGFRSTSSVDRLEWTEIMPGNIEFTEQAKRECAEALSKVLSDTFVLYLKTHNFHWNVQGRNSSVCMRSSRSSIGIYSIDEIAERIRALGQPAPGTTAKFQELADIKENHGIPPATEMLRELMSDNETATRSIRVALSTAQAAGDEATAGLLSDRLAYHEKQLWMMKSMAAP
jgi:starvation-inducible DNA-binding protein